MTIGAAGQGDASGAGSGSGANSSSGSGSGSIIVIAVLATVAGVAAGFVGGGFRWILDRAEELRLGLTVWAHTLPFGVLLPMVAVAVAAVLAALLVKLSPRASGSGIQDVEAVYRHELTPPPFSVVPARFFGGVLAIGSGLVLGREGPTVHMGASIGATAGRLAKLPDEDVRTLHTALSGAGLAVAFNAPIGGSLFVLEEVTKSAKPRIVLATVLSVAAAISAARLILGNHPDFSVQLHAEPPLATLPLFVLFGALVGLVGALYNLTITRLLAFIATLRHVSALWRAGVVGGLVGLMLFVDPLMVGGGDALSQMMLTGQTMALPTLLLYFVVRFLAGPLSYAAGTPGGLFAPLLALGALCGIIFSQVMAGIFPDLGQDFRVTLAIVGMTSLFAAVVRAPLTGIVLVLEMTAVTAITIPMLLAAGAAVLTTMLLRSPPVYDSLRGLMLSGLGR